MKEKLSKLTKVTCRKENLINEKKWIKNQNV